MKESFFCLCSMLSLLLACLVGRLEAVNFDETTDHIPYSLIYAKQFSDLESQIAPYLLGEDNRLHHSLAKLFSDPEILYDQASIDHAGFITLYHRSSGMRVLKHPKLKGYLIKAYLHSEKKKSGANFQWLIDRCKGAENIRNLITKKNLRYFTVPDKWIYLLPGAPYEDDCKQNAVLVVTDMQLVDREESSHAWKTKITKRHLRELYCILSHGFASCYLVHNIPYTKNGTFTCIDTAYPYRNYRRYSVKSYFSEEMKRYWDLLLVKHGEEDKS